MAEIVQQEPKAQVDPARRIKEIDTALANRANQLLQADPQAQRWQGQRDILMEQLAAVNGEKEKGPTGPPKPKAKRR